MPFSHYTCRPPRLLTRISLLLGDRPAVKVITVGPGNSFGELALMYNCPRAATVTALTDCVLWAIDRKTFTMVVVHSSNDKAQQYESFLSFVPLLDNLTDEERSRVADVLASRTYQDGEYIIHQGDDGNEFFIVESGEVACTISFDGAPPKEVCNPSPEPGCGDDPEPM